MTSDINVIALPSSCKIEQPTERLLQFCRREYAYYDAFRSENPDRIVPLDVLATVGVNAFFRVSADAVRTIHLGMDAACAPLLPALPEDADLVNFDPARMLVERLLHEAIQVPGGLIPVATKVLHRKRRKLVPILDNVVLAHYLNATPSKLPDATQDKRRAAAIAAKVLASFRNDLNSAYPEIEDIRGRLTSEGFPLTSVRILEVLIWTQLEERGYYR